MFEREYAVTIASSAASLDAFEDVLDRLTEAVLLGSPETGCAALTFTVVAVDVAEALGLAVAALLDRGLTIPDGASVTALEHPREGAA